MDVNTRALCYAYRNPGPGYKPMKLKDIRKLILKKPKKTKKGQKKPKRPTLSAIAQAAKNYLNDKKKRGRKRGNRNTTKAEDKEIMKKFHELRPPGKGITSRKLRNALPKKIKKKIGRLTIRRRLAEKGYWASHLERQTFPQLPPPRKHKTGMRVFPHFEDLWFSTFEFFRVLLFLQFRVFRI